MSHRLVRIARLSLIMLALLTVSACGYAAGASSSQTPSVGVPTASSQSTSTITTRATTTSAHATATSSATRAATAPTSTAAPTAPTESPTVERIIVSGAMTNGANPVVATCPNGTLALSGGWYFGNDFGSEVRWASRYGTNAWAVWAYASNSAPKGTSISVYVLCLQNVPAATVVERQEDFAYNPGETAQHDVNCNAGEVAVGGGFSTPGIDIYTFAPVAAGTGWSFTGQNNATNSTSFTLYTECLKAAHAVTKSFSSASTLVAGNASGSAQATCPAGSFLTGGGYSHDSVFVTMFDFHPQYPTWEVSISTDNNTAVQLTSSAVCLSFNG